MRRGGGRRRPDQVGEVVRRVVTDLLAREVRDPRIGLVTVTRVQVSPDLSHATLGVTAHGEEADRQRALQGLRAAAGFLRRGVAEALGTRTVPELHFDLDRGLEHARRIDELLAGLERHDA